MTLLNCGGNKKRAPQSVGGWHRILSQISISSLGLLFFTNHAEMEGSQEGGSVQPTTATLEGTCVTKACLREAAQLVARCKRLVVFSGAGISAESGIATFRDPESGVWLSKIGLAWFGTPFGWRWTPGLAWRMYLTRFRDPIARAVPNPGHHALARLEALICRNQARGSTPQHFDLITQNVDGLHQRAGNSIVWELHGTVNRHICSNNRHLHPYVIDPSKMDESYNPETDEFFTHEWKNSPRCPAEGCGSYLRPDAVLFGEALPEDQWSPAERAVAAMRPGDVMLVVGTSGVVYPAASLVDAALEKKGVHVIEVNPEASAITHRAKLFLRGPSGRVLPSLVDMVQKEWDPPATDEEEDKEEEKESE